MKKRGKKLLAMMLSLSMIVGTFTPLYAAEESAGANEAVAVTVAEEAPEATPASETTPETGSGTETTSGSESGNGTETVPGTPSEASPEVTPGAETGSGAEATPETKNETTPEATTGSESGSETETTPGSETGSGAETTPGSETGSEAETTPGSETGSGTETTPGSETGSGTETTPGSETGSAPETTPGSETGNEPEITPETTLGTESETTPTPTPGAENEATPTPTPAEAVGTVAPITGDAAVKMVDANGKEFAMFKVQGATAVLNGNKIDIAVVSSKATYSKLEIEGTVVEGVKNTAGFYNFSFSVAADYSGKNVKVVPIREDSGEGFSKYELFFTIPDLATTTPETTPTPEATPAPEESETAPITGDAAVKMVDANGKEFAMFKVQGATAVLNGDKIDIAVASSKATYSKLEIEGTVVEGVKNTAGFYNFSFSVAADYSGKNVKVVPIREDSGEGFSKYELFFTIPDLATPETTPTPAPEAPTPEAAPAENRVAVIKSNGAEYKMFLSVQDKTTAVIKDGKILVNLYISSPSYDRIYFGSKDDETKEPAITGTALAEGGYYFQFELPLSAKGTCSLVTIGLAGGDWSTKNDLWLYIPADIKEEQTAAPSVTPAEERIAVIKQKDGTEFTMFASVQDKTTAVVKDGKVLVDLYIGNENYDRIYLGSKDDESKEPAIYGTALAEGGYYFQFELPETAKGTCTEIALGNSEKWYSKQVLLLYIPTSISGGSPAVTPTPEATPTPTPKPTTDSSKIKNGVYSATVTTGAAMFKVVNCELKVVNGNMTAHITLSGSGYDYLYIGDAADANANTDKWIKYDGTVTSSAGKAQRTYTIPVSTLDKALVVASRSEEKGEWFSRTMTIDSGSLKKIRDLTAEELNAGGDKIVQGADEDDLAGNNTNDNSNSSTGSSNGATSAVNTSTGLADGVYTPDSFSWSGGSGRLSGISCTKITVKNGQAWATIVMGSDGYTALSANGSQYGAISRGGGTSTFEIPVQLNANNRISGLTTKMSAGHWVDYVLYIGLEAAKTASAGSSTADEASSGSVAGAMGDLIQDTDAPELTGLTYKGSLKLDYAQYYELHYYENDLAIIEVDITTDIAEAAEVQEDQTAEAAEELIMEEEMAAETTSEEENKRFGNDSVLYLIASQDAELPAGVEKEVVVVRIPAEKAYVDAENVLLLIDKFDAEERVAAVSFDASECEIADMKEAMEKEETTNVGSYQDLAFKELIKKDIDLAIVPSEILPHADAQLDEETVGMQLEEMENLGEQLQVLNIPMFIDRSADEKTEQAKCEWYKVYGALFGCVKDAEQLYEEAIEALQ